MGARNDRHASLMEEGFSLIESFTVPRPEACDECDFCAANEEGFLCCGANRPSAVQSPNDALAEGFVACRFIWRNR